MLVYQRVSILVRQKRHGKKMAFDVCLGTKKCTEAPSWSSTQEGYPEATIGTSNGKAFKILVSFLSLLYYIYIYIMLDPKLSCKSHFSSLSYPPFLRGSGIVSQFTDDYRWSCWEFPSLAHGKEPQEWRTRPARLHPSHCWSTMKSSRSWGWRRWDRSTVGFLDVKHGIFMVWHGKRCVFVFCMVPTNITMENHHF